jgi:hypothetical protein
VTTVDLNNQGGVVIDDRTGHRRGDLMGFSTAKSRQLWRRSGAGEDCAGEGAAAGVGVDHLEEVQGERALRAGHDGVRDEGDVAGAVLGARPTEVIVGVRAECDLPVAAATLTSAPLWKQAASRVRPGRSVIVVATGVGDAPTS